MDPATAASAAGGDVTSLLELVNAGGNVALLLCVYYIVQNQKTLVRLSAAIDALLYRIGFQIDQRTGDVTPIEKGK